MKIKSELPWERYTLENVISLLENKIIDTYEARILLGLEEELFQYNQMRKLS